MDSASSFGLLLLRLLLTMVFVAHGWNHVFGGGKLAGTARWFESLGMRPGMVHAVFASGTEIGAGVLLGAGLLTPVAAAGVVGVMLVALITTHLRNGFFIFRPGEGYEYVVSLILAALALALACLGSGRWSLDAAFSVRHMAGWWGFGIAALAGAGGAAALLLACWRPARGRE